jgi:predicted nicotinamide N-methyase
MKRVVELGAGTGAVGLSLALTGSPRSVILTDLPSVLPLTARNLASAALEHPLLADMAGKALLEVQMHQWGTEIQLDPVDVVLCSDCLYEPAVYDDLLQSLCALTQSATSNAAVVYIAYKPRHPE